MKQEMYEHIQEVERTHWWYVARRKMVFDWLARELDPRTAPRVLDVGCGTGFNIACLQESGYDHVMGLDSSSEALRYCRSRDLSRLVQGDASSPPLRSSSFDLIVALDVLEHLPGDAQALRSFARVLAPGGLLLLFVPALSFLWGFQDEVSHHYRRYTCRELREKLVLAGFTVRKLTYVNMFLLPLIWAGRRVLALFGNRIQGTSENDLHPAWSNGLLQWILAAERPLIRHVNLPVGVSLLGVAERAESDGSSERQPGQLASWWEHSIFRDPRGAPGEAS